MPSRPSAPANSELTGRPSNPTAQQPATSASLLPNANLHALSRWLKEETSVLETTCSSITLAQVTSPHQRRSIASEPAQNPWVLKLVKCPAPIQSLWMQYGSWPAKSVCVIGWVVSCEVKEYDFSVVLMIDDGTAVLECVYRISASSPLITGKSPKPVVLKDKALNKQLTNDSLQMYRQSSSLSLSNIGKGPDTALSNEEATTKFQKLVEPIKLGKTIKVKGQPLAMQFGTKWGLKIDAWKIVPLDEEVAWLKGLRKFRKNLKQTPFALEDVWDGYDEWNQSRLKQTQSQVDCAPSKIIKMRKGRDIPDEQLTPQTLSQHILSHLDKISKPVSVIQPWRPLPKQKQVDRLDFKKPEVSVTATMLQRDENLGTLAERIVRYEDSIRIAKAVHDRTQEDGRARPRIREKTPALLGAKSKKRTGPLQDSSASFSESQINLPESQLVGIQLKRRIDQLFSRVLLRLLSDGAIILSQEAMESSSQVVNESKTASGQIIDNSRRQVEDCFCLPTAKSIAPSILRALKTLGATAQRSKGRTSTEIRDLLARDDRWMCALGGTVTAVKPEELMGDGDEATLLEEEEEGVARGRELVEKALGLLNHEDEVQGMHGFWKLC